MKPLEIPNLWYGSFIMLSVATLYGLQLSAALYVPMLAPSAAASAAKSAK